MKKFEIKKDFSSNNENPNENKSLFKLEEEIKEIDEKIKENTNFIKEKNFPITSLNKSINEDSDYITKISMEKKSIVDSIDENYIINLTYQDSFKHDYQYDLIMILLQEINKVRFENKIEEQFKKNDCPVSESIGLEMKNRIKKELIIQNFKITCFNAWKFKNQILDLENINIIHKHEITAMKEKLDKLKNTALNIVDDNDYENFFEHIYKVIKVLLFLTVGQKKIDSSKAKLQTIKLEIKKSESIIYELTGKKQMLTKIYEKLKSKCENNNNTLVHKKVESPNEKIVKECNTFIKELKGLKNNIQMTLNSFLKQVGDNLIKPIDFQ